MIKIGSDTQKKYPGQNFSQFLSFTLFLFFHDGNVEKIPIILVEYD